MAAGVRHQFLMVASRAFDLHHGTGVRAALLQGGQCPVVLRGEPVPVLRQKVRRESFDDFSQADHLSCPHVMVKPSIKPLIRSRA
jgi:hypothetical protein